MYLPRGTSIKSLKDRYMSVIITIIKIIIILGFLILIHEAGHFFVARLCKIKVNEFSIGFGPKIVQKKYKETMYSLRCIPLGGYCAIEGEDGESDSKNSFGSKNVFQKVVVLVAGVTFKITMEVERGTIDLYEEGEVIGTCSYIHILNVNANKVS